MARTRERAKGRRGGEGERFSYIPEHVMVSPALATANHASFHVLAILVVGKPKERNGTMMCSDSYAARYGINSHDTLSRALTELKERGLIVVTRQGMKMRKIPTLWAVTWWPIYYRDGQPLPRPEDATFAHREWKPVTPTSGVEANSHTDCRGNVAPTIGVQGTTLHPDLPGDSRHLHPDHRGYSKNLGVGSALNGSGDKVLKLMRLQPHLPDSEIANITHEAVELVQWVRENRFSRL